METLPMILEAILCLAVNGFHEARGETRTAQLAVAHVVLNRADRYGTSVCWEVFRAEQFSWTNDIDKLRKLPDGDKWEEAQSVAHEARGGNDFTGGALFYHHVGIKPRWSKGMKKTGRWGSHVFYK